jgi:PIN domain nuclease of toxin-antitoxin system
MMRILLDTHILVWTLMEPGRLASEQRAPIEDGATEVLFSAVNIWEIAIKHSLRRPGFIFQPAEITRAALGIGFTELPVRSNAAVQVAALPLLHRDPFDRLLIAQAIVERAELYTADAQLVPYSNLVQLIRAR